MISWEYNGHIHYGSGLDSCDSCGNCDGANCDGCSKVYTVNGMGFKKFHTIEKAEDAASEMVILCPQIKEGEPEFFIKDNALWCGIYIYDKDNPYTGNKEFQCNVSSKFYKEKFDEIEKQGQLWVECQCKDKDKSLYGNSCDVYKKCNDDVCRSGILKGKGRRDF